MLGGGGGGSEGLGVTVSVSLSGGGRWERPGRAGGGPGWCSVALQTPDLPHHSQSPV